MKTINSRIKQSNNSSFVILIFEISKLRNISRSTFRRSKFRPALERFKRCELSCMFSQKDYALHLRSFWIFDRNDSQIRLKHFSTNRVIKN